MGKKDSFLKNSSSIIEEVEEQLNKILDERRKKIQEDLEEAINKQKEEAESKISEIESEVNEERESLSEYKTILSEFEDEKTSIKDEIKSHLKIVMKLQSDIESLTGKSLAELKIIEELNKKLESINEETTEKLSTLRKKLEEKYGIEAEIPENIGPFNEDFDLDDELQRLSKIKELLGENGSQIDVTDTFEEQIEEKIQEDAGAVDAEPEENEDEESVKSSDEKDELENEKEEGVKLEEREDQDEEENGEEEEDEEDVEEEEEDEDTGGYEKLDKFKKTEGSESEAKVVYFENEGKITLDGKYVINSVKDEIDQADKLYGKLDETTSPKEHFFIKQEIIQEQENVRKLILGCLRVCEMKDCFFPESTKDVLNEDKLKEMLERVSMENWSNRDDFNAFSEYIDDIKTEFDSKSSPLEEYTESIIKELSG